MPSVQGTERVTRSAPRCGNPACALRRTVYRPAQAGLRQVKGSGDGLDVVAHRGALRLGEHRTRPEIGRQVRTQTPVPVAERHIPNVVEVSLALLRASEADRGQRLASTVAQHGGIIVALDGLQPEPGKEPWWGVRELLSGAVLAAAQVQPATAGGLAHLREPSAAAPLPVLGGISDAQESIRLAVAQVVPGVPHPTCPYHAAPEAAGPLGEADRGLLVEAKKEVRGRCAVEERVRRAQQEEPAHPSSAVVRETVVALRQTVRACGVLPFACAGRCVLEALGAGGQTLDRCRETRGTPTWCGGAP